MPSVPLTPPSDINANRPAWPLWTTGIGSLWLFWPYGQWLTATWQRLYLETYGYLALPVILWAFVRERNLLSELGASPSRRGWLFFLPGLCLAFFARTVAIPSVAGVALPLYLYGLCLLAGGTLAGRRLLFPICFCLFLYPWDAVVESLVGVHLRMASTWAAYVALRLLGIGASLSGCLIDTGRLCLNVVPGCSGLTALKVLFFVGAVAAYLHPGGWSRKALLWMSAIPLAMGMNMLRIVSVGLVGHFLGPALATAFFHEISGPLFFGMALLLMYGLAAVLKPPFAKGDDR